MEAVIIASVATDDNPHRERQHAVNALRAAAQDVERNQVGPWNRPQFAYTNSSGTRILKDVNHLKEQVTNLTGAFRAERERAQRESEAPGFPRYRDRLSQARYQVPHQPCPAHHVPFRCLPGRRWVKVARKWYRE